MSDEELQLEEVQEEVHESDLHDDLSGNEDLQDSEDDRKVRAFELHSKPTRSHQISLIGLGPRPVNLTCL